MNFEHRDNGERIEKFMSDAARQRAQLQRGYDRMAFIVGAIIGIIGAIQNSAQIFQLITVPIFSGFVFVFIRKALSGKL